MGLVKHCLRQYYEIVVDFSFKTLSPADIAIDKWLRANELNERSRPGPPPTGGQKIQARFMILQLKNKILKTP